MLFSTDKMFQRVLLAVLFWTALVTPCAWAFTDAQDARYLSGKELLKSEQYEEAANVFRGVLQEIRINSEDRWQLLVALAVTYDKAGDWVSALEYYEAFLRALTPELAESDEKWRTRYELAVQTRHDLQARIATRFGRVSLDSEPPGASVWINGKRAGIDADAVTPYVAYLPPGNYEIALTRQTPRGETRAEKGVTIDLNRPQTWLASLREKVALLNAVDLQPGDGMGMEPVDHTTAWVVIGSGAALGAGGLVMTVLAMGTHDELGALSLASGLDRDQARLQWANLEDQLQTRQATSWALYGVSGALIGLGTWLFFSDFESGDAPVAGVQSGLNGGPPGAVLTF